MGQNLNAVRQAVEQAKVIAAEFRTGTANFYKTGGTTPVFADVPVRVRKPKPSAFDAGNQTENAYKRGGKIKAPLDLTAYAASGVDPNVITKGLLVKISTPDGDPTINNIDFFVQSALTSQFAAEREIVYSTEVVKTARIA